MLPLLFPWIVLALVIFAIILTFCKKWRIVALLVVLAIAVNWWSECIPLRLWNICKKTAPRSISVMAFNISGTKQNIDEKVEKLVKIIVDNSPDIIYVAEINKHNKRLLDTLLINYFPYTYCCYSHGFYSKYPLSKVIILEENNIREKGVLKCLAVNGTDTIALYGCHLPSNNYAVGPKYVTPDSIKSHSTLVQYIKDIKLAYKRRIRSAGVIIRDASKLKKTTIVLGDMNDVGGSKTIRLMESIGLKDVWWEGGFGYGATIHNPLPYRIDHIMYTNQFKLNRVKVVSSEGLSDHDAVFAEFSYKENYNW